MITYILEIKLQDEFFDEIESHLVEFIVSEKTSLNEISFKLTKISKELNNNSKNISLEKLCNTICQSNNWKWNYFKPNLVWNETTIDVNLPF